MLKKLLSTLLTWFLLFFTFATSPAHSGPVDIGSVFQVRQDLSVGDYVSAFLKASITIAGIIALLLVVFGGIGMIVSAGSAQQQEKGKGATTAGVLGLVLVVSAYWIIQIIQVLTGVDILNSGL